MGVLKCGNLDFSNLQLINTLQQRTQYILDNINNYHALIHTRNYYFATPTGLLPKVPGWYIILDNVTPIYVGMAANLNNRLNSKNGTRDQFANPQRKSENVRNFIKKYTELGIIRNLRVCIISETALFSDRRLNKLDRANVEKILDIWRGTFRFINHEEHRYHG